MNEAASVRTASAEIDWGQNPGAIHWMGPRTLHQYWPLLSPYFGDLFLPPQRRSGRDIVAWTWQESAGAAVVSTEELGALRAKLTTELQWFDEGIGRSMGEMRPDDSGSLMSRESLGQLQRVMGAWVMGLLAKPDFEFKKYACRTAKGLRLHSWGATQAALPRFVGMGEVCGTVWIEAAPGAGCEVSLATAAGRLVAKVTTDARGNFCLRSNTPGRFRLGVSAAQVVFAPESLEVAIRHETIGGIEFHGVSDHEAGGPWPGYKRLRRMIARCGNWRVFLSTGILLLGLIWLAREQSEPEVLLSPPPRPDTASPAASSRSAVQPPALPEPPMPTGAADGPGSLAAQTGATAGTAPDGRPAPGIWGINQADDAGEIQPDADGAADRRSDFLGYEEEDRIVGYLPAASPALSPSGIPGAPGLAGLAPRGAASPLPPSAAIRRASGTTALPLAAGLLPAGEPGRHAGRKHPDMPPVMRPGKVIPRMSRAADSPEFEASGTAGNSKPRPETITPESSTLPAPETAVASPAAGPLVHVKSVAAARPEKARPSDAVTNGFNAADARSDPPPEGLAACLAVQVSRPNWRPALLQDVILPTRPMPAGTEDSLAMLRTKLNQEMQAARPQYLQTCSVRQGYRIEWAGQERFPRPYWERLRGNGYLSNRVDESSAILFWDAGSPEADILYVLQGGQEKPLATVRVRPGSGSLVVADARVKVSLVHEIMLAGSGAALPPGTDFRMELNTGAGSIRRLTPVIVRGNSGYLCFCYQVPLPEIYRRASFAFFAAGSTWGLVGEVTLQREKADAWPDWPPAE